MVEAYKTDIDRTLIRENLKLTPEQRILQLMRLQAFARSPHPGQARGWSRQGSRGAPSSKRSRKSGEAELGHSPSAPHPVTRRDSSRSSWPGGQCSARSDTPRDDQRHVVVLGRISGKGICRGPSSVGGPSPVVAARALDTPSGSRNSLSGAYRGAGSAPGVGAAYRVCSSRIRSSACICCSVSRASERSMMFISS